MINIKVDLKLGPLDKKIKSIGPITRRSLKEIGRTEVLSTQNRIALTKVDPEGRAWTPWSLSTLRSRMREGTASTGLLYRTGELFRSIYFKVANMSLEVGSKARYAKFLQNGTTRMPARRFIGFSNNTVNKLIALFKTEMDK